MDKPNSPSWLGLLRFRFLSRVSHFAEHVPPHAVMAVPGLDPGWYSRRRGGSWRCRSRPRRHRLRDNRLEECGDELAQQAPCAGPGQAAAAQGESPRAHQRAARAAESADAPGSWPSAHRPGAQANHFETLEAELDAPSQAIQASTSAVGKLSGVSDVTRITQSAAASVAVEAFLLRLPSLAPRRRRGWLRLSDCHQTQRKRGTVPCVRDPGPARAGLAELGKEIDWRTISLARAHSASRRARAAPASSTAAMRSGWVGTITESRPWRPRSSLSRAHRSARSSRLLAPPGSRDDLRRHALRDAIPWPPAWHWPMRSRACAAARQGHSSPEHQRRPANPASSADRESSHAGITVRRCKAMGRSGDQTRPSSCAAATRRRSHGIECHETMRYSRKVLSKSDARR